MSSSLESPEELTLKPAGKTCAVHGELVSVLVKMNKKLNLLIAAALLAGGAVMGKELLGAILTRMAGG